MCHVNTYSILGSEHLNPTLILRRNWNVSLRFKLTLLLRQMKLWKIFREDGRKTVLRLVEMESSYLTVEFSRKLPLEGEKGNNPAAPTTDRYGGSHLRRMGMCWIMSVFVLRGENI